jgi:hypothetical protein
MKSRKIALVLSLALIGVLASGCAIPPILKGAVQGALGAAGQTAAPAAPGAAPAAPAAATTQTVTAPAAAAAPAPAPSTPAVDPARANQ